MDGKSSGQNGGGLPDIKNALKGTKTADRNEIAKLKMEHEEAQREAQMKKLYKVPILRMKVLRVEDYYSEADKQKDIQAIGAFFDKRKGNKCLDGKKMIDLFVKENKMTQWNLTKKTKKLREVQVQSSYSKAQELLNSGRLDHIPLPRSSLREALDRESTNKYDFQGIIHQAMVSYRLEDLDAASAQFSKRDGMNMTWRDENPLNAMNVTGGFSQGT